MPDLLRAIQLNKDISDVTKKNYREAVSAICRAVNLSVTHVNDLVLNPDLYLGKLKAYYKKPTSQKTHMATIKGLFKYNTEFKEKNLVAYDKWSAAYAEALEKVTARYDENKPSERQQQGYVDYAEIIKMRDALVEGSMERLLLDMYTYIKPKRCEYARVAMYRDKLPAKKDQEDNYILLNKLGTKGTIVLRRFKTDKSFEPFEASLDPALLKDLMLSLEEQPRDYLFVGERTKKPHTPNRFTQWTTQVLSKLFGRPLTVSLIRHSYINTIDFNSLSIREKRDIATEMAHSVETQDKYRLLFDTKKQRCECECTTVTANEPTTNIRTQARPHPHPNLSTHPHPHPLPHPHPPPSSSSSTSSSASSQSGRSARSGKSVKSIKSIASTRSLESVASSHGRLVRSTVTRKPKLKTVTRNMFTKSTSGSLTMTEKPKK